MQAPLQSWFCERNGFLKACIPPMDDVRRSDWYAP